MQSATLEPTQRLLTGVITKLQGSILKLDHNKIQVARDINWAHSVINWRLTKYRGFVGFVRAELTLGPTSVYHYKVVGELLERYKYTDQDAKNMVDVLGWHRFSHGLCSMTRRMSVKRFNIKYRYASTSTCIPVDGDPDGDRVYTFSLPCDYANQLDVYLEKEGMRQSNGQRFGVRKAFMALIDRKFRK